MLITFRFSEKWLSWVGSCHFVGNLAVLVNGCPTQDISIQKGLKQKNRIATILFYLVAKGLGGLVARAEDIGLYSRFKVDTSWLVLSYLQYVYDTLLVTDHSV